MSYRVTFRTTPVAAPRPPARRRLVEVPAEAPTLGPGERHSRIAVGRLGPLTEIQSARRLVAAVLLHNRAAERRRLKV